MSNKEKVLDQHIGPDVTMQQLVCRMLQMIEPANAIEMREGLRGTPDRVAKAMAKWFEGYAQDPAEILSTSFEDGAEQFKGMVSVKDIPLYSKCEHHMADIIGVVTVAYIPNGRVVGLSKISRLVNCFARRLQVQERITSEVADAIMEHLQPYGVAVCVRARHMCMESRGVCQQGHHTETIEYRGVFSKPDNKYGARSEFGRLIGHSVI